MQYELVKFIAMGGPRSGSSWLHSALSRHPDIWIGGEVLDDPYLKQNPWFASNIWAGIEGIWTPSVHKAKGFKLFYYQCWDYYREHAYVWNRFQNDKSIKVIFLIRQNLLKMLVSWDMALKTNVWGAMKPLENRPKIFIDPKRVVERIATIEAGLCRIKNMFAKHEQYSLTYEGLFAHTNEHLEKIQQLLQVEPRILHSPLCKMETRALSDTIENYAEVYKAISESDYDEFLELQ